MDSKIFQNSYIIFALSFCLIYTTFYLFGIGYVTTYEGDKPVIKMGWKYPLGLSIIVWVFWHYCMYPSEDYLNEGYAKPRRASPRREVTGSPFQFEPRAAQQGGGDVHPTHKMDMRNWI